jgi:acetyl-CoA carboxylase biotin carboxylase subunit
MSILFVANRAEIASRVIATASKRGFTTAIAYPEVDAELPYVRAADIRIQLESPRSFIDAEQMVAAATQVGASFVHPGYGFLSENTAFARAVEAAGMTFVGPSPEVIEQMGDKANARAIAIAAGVPVTRGSDEPITEFREAQEVANQVGFPLMIKAVAGGGGIGMAVVRESQELQAAFDQVSGRAATVFGDPRLIVEQYIARSRHIEVQVMGLPNGEVVAFAERDCSVQRRHQKVIEESPSPILTSSMREAIVASARELAESVGYTNAGTVEFIFDQDKNEFYFLEMNTRLQVEHPVTEALHSVDLVAWQLSVASGHSQYPEGFSSTPNGHAIELRLYAEDSVRFLPRPGKIARWEMPVGDRVRVDAGYEEGNTVTPFFDPLMAKITTHGRDRQEALQAAVSAIESTVVEGPGCNRDYLQKVLKSDAFAEGTYSTGLVIEPAA